MIESYDRSTPRVYVAGPYSAEDYDDRADNAGNAEYVGGRIIAAGCYPVVPHRNIDYEDICDDNDFLLAATLDELRTCDACVILPNWQKSVGTTGERNDCIESWRPCFEIKGPDLKLPDDFREWVNGWRERKARYEIVRESTKRLIENLKSKGSM